MRRTQTIRIGDLWSDFLKSAPTIARKIAEAKVADVWPQVAGPAGRYTTSVETKDGIVTVRLSSSVMRSELFMRRSEIKEAINRALGQDVVRNIIIK